MSSIFLVKKCKITQLLQEMHEKCRFNGNIVRKYLLLELKQKKIYIKIVK